MNSIDENIAAVTGGGRKEDTDWKAKYEELSKQFNGVRVEEGRVKKLDEELKAAQAKIAEYESRSEELDLINSIPEETRSEIPDEVLSASAKIAASAMKGLKSEIDEERRYRTEASKRAFFERIEREAPGFLTGISEGGDKKPAWDNYLRHNRESVSYAIQNGDYDSMAYHIQNFYRSELGIPVPSGGMGGSAVPDPRSSVGGGGAQYSANGKTYSYEEWSNLPDRAEMARDKGDIAECKRLYSEYEKAPAEKRVLNAS